MFGSSRIYADVEGTRIPRGQSMPVTSALCEAEAGGSQV